MGIIYTVNCLDCQKRIYVGKKEELQSSLPYLLITAEFILEHHGHFVTALWDMEPEAIYRPEVLKREPKSKLLNDEYYDRVALALASIHMDELVGFAKARLESLKGKYVGSQITEKQWLDALEGSKRALERYLNPPFRKQKEAEV